MGLESDGSRKGTACVHFEQVQYAGAGVMGRLDCAVEVLAHEALTMAVVSQGQG